MLFFKAAETMVYSSNVVVQIVNPNDQFMNLEILMKMTKSLEEYLVVVGDV